jgi:hypothetical protein
LDSLYGFNHTQRLHEPNIHLGYIAYAADNRFVFACAYVRRDFAILKPGDETLDLFGNGIFFQYDYHLSVPFNFNKTKTAALFPERSRLGGKSLIVSQAYAQPLRPVKPK